MGSVIVAATGMVFHYLVTDARERAIIPFLEAAFEATFGERPHAPGVARAPRLISGRQITTGDYLICAATPGAPPRIRACIERKTLADFAASFKDGRHANVQKLRALRQQTGCQLYYLVEGPAFPSPARRFARIPYGSILSAITNLMVRDQIMVVQTENEMHTAKRLADIVRAFEKFTEEPAVVMDTVGGAADAGGAPATDAGGAPATDAVVAADAGIAPAADASIAPASDAGIAPEAEFDCGIPALATAPSVQSDADAVVAIWAQLRGVSPVLGKILSQQFSIAELASGAVTVAQIHQLRTATGRIINASAVASLCEVANMASARPVAAAPCALRLLSGMRGITVALAERILLSAQGMAQLALATNVDACADIQIPKGGKMVRLGAVRASRIQRLLTYKQPAR